MDKAISFLRQHDNYLLLTHRRPDGDTLGSAVALCAGLRSLGKTSYLWRNPEITSRYLPYTEPFFAPEGYAHEHTVAVDIASKSLLGEGFDGRIHLRVDHHPNKAGYADIEYTEPSAAACGEVVMELLAALGVPLTKEIATPLYIAISTDTGIFRYSNTTARTFRCAAALMETGINLPALNTELFSKSRRRLAIETVVSENIRYSAGDRVAVTSLSLKEKGTAAEDDLENLAGLAQGIQGVEVVLLLREEKGGWRVSCRVVKPYSARRICEALGGGGHERAAGAEIKGKLTPEAARERALEAV